jgi:hypothetical protein
MRPPAISTISIFEEAPGETPAARRAFSFAPAFWPWLEGSNNNAMTTAANGR